MGLSKSTYLSGSTKVVRVPTWLADDVKLYCHRREVNLFREEVARLKSAIPLVADAEKSRKEALARPAAPQPKTARKQRRAAQKRKGKR